MSKVVEHIIEELEEENNQLSRLQTSRQSARIDVIQIGPEERSVERMQELPTPPDASTPEPTTMPQPMPRFLQTPILTFIGELERATMLQSPFKTLGSNPVQKFPINLVQSGGSNGPKAKQELEPSGSGRSSGEGADVV